MPIAGFLSPFQGLYIKALKGRKTLAQGIALLISEDFVCTIRIIRVIRVPLYLHFVIVNNNTKQLYYLPLSSAIRKDV